MQNSVLVGSHLFLSVCPIRILILIYAVIYSSLWIGRWVFEGRGYDVAHSSKFGDAALATFVITAAWIIKQSDFHPADWMEGRTFHFIIAGISIMTAIIYFLVTRPKREMDIWHAFFVFPVFLYLIATTIPVYWKYLWRDSISAGLFFAIAFIGIVLLLLWVFLVIDDIKEKRMDQRKWIAKNHPDWKFKN
jgi:hypothetical protein